MIPAILPVVVMLFYIMSQVATLAECSQVIEPVV
jgi:hypothetical protein